MDIEYLKKDDLETVRRLIIDYKFNDYRNYQVLRKKSVNECLFKQIEDLLSVNKGISVVAAKKGKSIVGLVVLADLSWDSKHFGFKMAEITNLVARGSYQESFEIKSGLISFILNICQQNGIRHLSCRIDTADFSGIHALEESSFKIMGILVTYIFNIFNLKMPNLKALYKVRMFQKKDLNSLLKLSENSFLNSRFYKDVYMPKEKVDKLYREWVKSSCNQLENHKVFVAEKDNKITGFFIYRKKRELEKVLGIKIFGHGLSAVFPAAKGTYPLLVKAALDDGAISGCDIAEFDTQLNNQEVIRIWQKLGARFVRSKHTFHKWLPADVR